jgi:two-component system OmpR family sensor kinase
MRPCWRRGWHGVGHGHGHGHGPQRHGHHRHGPHRRRLQHQLFWSFGVAILATMLVSGAVFAGLHGVAGHRPWMRPLGLLAAGSVLWLLSGVAARRIARPLHELMDAARRFGTGKLDARARPPRHGAAELRELTATFNEMAGRIETQLTQQRELIGAVSHELRTPLARLRVLLAMLQESGADAATTAKVERELVEMDALVGELLAGARVEAGALQIRWLETTDTVQSSLERSGLMATSVHVASDAARIEADATLVSRALLVLLDNAKKHGGGQVQVTVAREGELVRFTVRDAGPGFDPVDLPRLFTPFARGRGQGPDEARGVGLGLYLVRRIAEAHGGQAFARNAEPGGAEVGFSVRSLRPAEMR